MEHGISYPFYRWEKEAKRLVITYGEKGWSQKHNPHLLTPGLLLIAHLPPINLSLLSFNSDLQREALLRPDKQGAGKESQNQNQEAYETI